MAKRRQSEPDAVKANKAAYYQRHSDRLKARQAQWRDANPGRAAEWARQRRIDNPDIVRSYERERYASTDGAARRRQQRAVNPKRGKAVIAAWRAANPDKVRDYDRRKRYKRKGIPGRGITLADERQMWDEQDGRCLWCRLPLGDDYHVDHLHPISRGGKNEPENAALTCPTCNMRKHSLTVTEWMERQWSGLWSVV